MDQTQAVEQPATDSASLDALLDAKFGGMSDEPEQQEQPEAPEPEAQQGDEAEEQTESEGASPEFVEVEYQGTKYQVPPELKDALMYQADYTAKTTETARLRETLQIQQKEVALYQEARAFEQSIGEDADRLKMLDAFINHQKAQTNWSQMTTDQIVRAKLELDQLSEQRNQLDAALKAKRQEFSQKIEGERSELKKAASEILAKAIPNWNDESRSAIEKHAATLGYPEMAVQNMSATDYQVLWESMQYRKVKSEAKNAVKKAADAPVIAPTARRNPMPKDVRAKLDLKNAQRTGDKAKQAVALDRRLDQLFGG